MKKIQKMITRIEKINPTHIAQERSPLASTKMLIISEAIARMGENKPKFNPNGAELYRVFSSAGRITEAKKGRIVNIKPEQIPRISAHQVAFNLGFSLGWLIMLFPMRLGASFQTFLRLRLTTIIDYITSLKNNNTYNICVISLLHNRFF